MTLCRRCSNVDFSSFIWATENVWNSFEWTFWACVQRHIQKKCLRIERKMWSLVLLFSVRVFFILFYYHFAEKLPEFIPEHVAIHASDKEYWINLFFCAVCIFFIYVSSSLNSDVGRQSKNSNYIRSRDRYLSPVKASKDVIAALMILFMHLFKSNDK